MNTAPYDSGRSYYIAPSQKTETVDSSSSSKKVSKSTEAFKELVLKVATKSVNQIESSEVENLVNSLRSLNRSSRQSRTHFN